MMENVSLFKELKSGGYESSLITTFNAYFPFYEDVLLRRLRSSGVQKNTILIDETMCSQAMEEAYPVLAGRHYTLAPMACSKAFHPKVVLLLGKKKGLLAVGSHNLTFSGYGFNAELTNLIRFDSNSDQDTVHLFWTAWLAIQTWLKDYGSKIPGATIKSINATIEGIDWLKPIEINGNQELQFIYSSRSTASLWSQVLPLVPKQPEQCHVIGAFFDNQLSFINSIKDDIRPKTMFVGVQPTLVHGPDILLNMRGVSLVNSDVLLLGNENNKYIHAKAIYFKGETDNALIVGSANPSSPAWIQEGSKCNAEAVLVRIDINVPSTASYLGFDALLNAPQVDEILTESRTSSDVVQTGVSKVIVGYIQGEKLIIDLPVKFVNSTLCLENNMEEVIDKFPINSDQDRIEIKVDASIRSTLVKASIWEGDLRKGIILIFLVDEIDFIAAKGTKKKFRDALGSLGTDSPELKVLFNCLDKIIFDNKPELLKNRTLEAKGSDKDQKNEGNSLVVEWLEGSNTIKSKSKRLKVSDDLTTLLDAFVYRLGMNVIETSVFNGEDKFGRNEEELIGSDDDEEEDLPVDNSVNDGLSDEQKLIVCHRRVNTIVNKMCVRLKVLKEKEITHLELLPALLAVMSLLKELNQRSRDFDWVNEEFMILPLDATKKLFSNICEYWWGSNYGLSHKTEGNNDILEEVDELVRLRGLFVWLGWYVGLVYKPKITFWEEKKDRNSRLWMNSAYTLIAQLVVSDELIEEEASIICASENDDCLKWFSELVKFGVELKHLYQSVHNDKANLARPTDNTWVLHEDDAFIGVRFCHVADDKYVQMPSVAKEGEFKRFVVDKLLSCP